MDKMLDWAAGGRSVLLDAYDAVRHGDRVADLAGEYIAHFAPVVPPASDKVAPFELFSLIDPSIQTTVKSTTT